MLIPSHKPRKDYSEKTPVVPKKVAWIRIRRGARKNLITGDLIGGNDNEGERRNRIFP